MPGARVRHRLERDEVDHYAVEVVVQGRRADEGRAFVYPKDVVSPGAAEEPPGPPLGGKGRKRQREAQVWSALDARPTRRPEA